MSAKIVQVGLAGLAETGRVRVHHGDKIESKSNLLLWAHDAPVCVCLGRTVCWFNRDELMILPEPVRTG